jgi:hypothetical protein
VRIDASDVPARAAEVRPADIVQTLAKSRVLIVGDHAGAPHLRMRLLPDDGGFDDISGLDVSAARQALG